MESRPVRPDDLCLRTRFSDRVRFEFSEHTDGMVRYFHRRLIERGLRVCAVPDGGDLLLHYELSIEDAFSLGYNHAGPEQLEAALRRCYPELAADPDALRLRLQELHRPYVWSRRVAS